MFLTLKNEKTLKKMRSKTLKNNIFFILGRNLIIRSFEIPHSIWKLHKDFKSVFVFKFRQKTKKFTPKWQKPLFEKRVPCVTTMRHQNLHHSQNTTKLETKCSSEMQWCLTAHCWWSTPMSCPTSYPPPIHNSPGSVNTTCPQHIFKEIFKCIKYEYYLVFTSSR